MDETHAASPDTPAPLASSFRDPSGFLFEREGVLYRQVNPVYAPHYDRLVSSGLLAALVRNGLLIPHDEADPSLAPAPPCHRVIRPERIPFLSWPCEWSFSMLRDAALLTLDACRRALDAGLILKDATAYNVQFRAGRPILIDTLSFETYTEGAPWVAYRQFCQHFLAPLALMAKTDLRLLQLLRIHLDGVPLDLASRLLPWSTRLRLGLLVHLHLHARSQRRYERKTLESLRDDRSLRDCISSRLYVTRFQLLGILDSLRSTVSGLAFPGGDTEWGVYYTDTNYDPAAFEAKRRLLEQFVERERPASVWDLGANDGTFSRIAASRGIPTLAFDIDPVAVEKNYRAVTRDREANLLPLLLDLTNPTPGLGFENREREALLDRGRPAMCFALALVHHLALSNNLPLPRLTDFFAGLTDRLAIEWVPKSDSKVQFLLATRADVFPDYTQAGFEAAFGRRFRTIAAEPIPGSERILYLLENRTIIVK